MFFFGCFSNSHYSFEFNWNLWNTLELLSMTDNIDFHKNAVEMFIQYLAILAYWMSAFPKSYSFRIFKTIESRTMTIRIFKICHYSCNICSYMWSRRSIQFIQSKTSKLEKHQLLCYNAIFVRKYSWKSSFTSGTLLWTCAIIKHVWKMAFHVFHRWFHPKWKRALKSTKKVYWQYLMKIYLKCKISPNIIRSYSTSPIVGIYIQNQGHLPPCKLEPNLWVENFAWRQ